VSRKEYLILTNNNIVHDSYFKLIINLISLTGFSVTSKFEYISVAALLLQGPRFYKF